MSAALRARIVAAVDAVADADGLATRAAIARHLRPHLQADELKRVKKALARAVQLNELEACGQDRFAIAR